MTSRIRIALVGDYSAARFAPGSRLGAIYGVPAAKEEYHRRYGLSAEYADRLRAGPLVASARDSAGEVRPIELEGHPFFIAILFQPERSALAGRRHPLMRAFVEAGGTGMLRHAPAHERGVKHAR